MGITSRWNSMSDLPGTEPPLTLGPLERTLVEDLLAYCVVVLVEPVDRLEVAVDHDVEQPVQEEADAVGGECLRTVPPCEDGLEVEALVLADGDEPPRVDERVDLRRSARSPVTSSSRTAWHTKNKWPG